MAQDTRKLKEMQHELRNMWENHALRRKKGNGKAKPRMVVRSNATFQDQDFNLDRQQSKDRKIKDIISNIEPRENTNQFIIAWHYGSIFFVKPNNLKYENGKVEYMDFVEVDDFKKLTVDKVARFMMYLGYKLPVRVLYMREMMSLLNGLVRIKNMEDVQKMLDGICSSKLLEVYLVPPARTFVLSWESPTMK
ncbi:Uncharacterized protein Fot_24251 [Forsythia ovata]|uniref:PB1-like domain-containing protein n=1 Tax=Forsythia ovata TaxID=205694 RepID=A0ABD1U6D8_9LAMI